MKCLDFQVKMAIDEAVISFRHLSPALVRILSEQILSESFVRVIVRAVDLIVLLISSVMVIKFLSSGSILIGMAAGAEARILPINSLFAKLVNKWGGIPKLRRFIKAAHVLASNANCFRYGNVVKFVS